jgi:hypothetical protein
VKVGAFHRADLLVQDIQWVVNYLSEKSEAAHRGVFGPQRLHCDCRPSYLSGLTNGQTLKETRRAAQRRSADLSRKGLLTCIMRRGLAGVA